MQQITRFSKALSITLAGIFTAATPSFASATSAVNIGSAAATIAFYLLIVAILLAAIFAEVLRSSSEKNFDNNGRPAPTEITLVARPRQV